MCHLDSEDEAVKVGVSACAEACVSQLTFCGCVESIFLTFSEGDLSVWW